MRFAVPFAESYRTFPVIFIMRSLFVGYLCIGIRTVQTYLLNSAMEIVRNSADLLVSLFACREV